MLQPVRGTHDLYGADYTHHQWIVETARSLAQLYGFQNMETPLFEFASVFAGLGETSDVVSKETYTFQDRGGEHLSLRPEGTAGVMRAIVSNGLTQHVPLKYFYAGPMFRYDRPQKGRYRQFHQVGVELVGVEKPQADVEVLMLAAQFLQALGLKDQVTLEINTLGDAHTRETYRAALVDYLQPRMADLSQESQQRLSKNPLRILDSKDARDQEILNDAPLYQDFWSPESGAFFDSVRRGLDDAGIAYQINPRLVRGLDYYCHTVFEFTTSALGAQGTVLAGGRYAGLSARMGGTDLPGVGWAAGVERLRLLSQNPSSDMRPIALVPLGETAEQHALMLSYKLRQSGIVVDLAYSGNLSKRMRRADKMGARAALVFGDDELKQGQYLLKDLDVGDQKAIDQEGVCAALALLR